MTDPIRIIIADDQGLIRSGLRAILDIESDLEVVAEADNGAAAARAADEHQADVVLMDVEMPGCNGVEGVRRLTASRPEAKALMLTMFDLDEYVYDALRAGASGFLLKTASPGDLSTAIRAVHAGDMLFSPAVTRRLVQSYIRRRPTTQGIPPILTSLTDRELDVLRSLAQGLSNAEISASLYLGEATVKTHVTRILAKLGLRDRVQAVVLAHESGLAQTSSPDSPA